MRTATIIAAAAAVTLVGCSSTDSTAAPPGTATEPSDASAAAPATAEPRTQTAVRNAASEEFDSFASGDYGGAWDSYYTPAKRLISRANYIRLYKLCPDIAPGARFEIQKITMDSDHEAHVRVSRLAIAVASYQFVYEVGHWRFVPPADSMRDYRQEPAVDA